MKVDSKKIAYAGAATALAAIFCIITLYLPLKVTPLLAASLCFYIAFSKGNVAYGVLSIAATLLITFFFRGVSVTLILVGMIFAPYSVIAFALKKFTYFRVKGCLIRVGIILAFINVMLFLLYLFIGKIALGYGDLNFIAAAQKVGGYWVIAIIVSVLALIFDFTFTLAAYKIGKVLKLRGAERNNVSDKSLSDQSVQGPFSEYDGDKNFKTNSGTPIKPLADSTQESARAESDGADQDGRQEKEQRGEDEKLEK